jgi:hypothetical protein
MASAGAGLRHRPDAVICGLDGPGSFTLIDVKTFDVCGATHIDTHHTDRRRFAAHTAVTTRCVRDDYGVLPPRMRLVVVAVSTGGSLSTSTLRFFSDLGRRAGLSVPFPLLACSTWATPRFAPFVRMAVSHAVRRGLAESVCRWWERVRDPSDVHSAPPIPAPVAVRPSPADAQAIAAHLFV